MLAHVRPGVVAGAQGAAAQHQRDEADRDWQLTPVQPRAAFVVAAHAHVVRDDAVRVERRAAHGRFARHLARLIGARGRRALGTDVHDPLAVARVAASVVREPLPSRVRCVRDGERAEALPGALVVVTPVETHREREREREEVSW